MTCFLRNILLGIVFLFLALPSAQATHIIGGEMNYSCLGNNLYQISLTVYRDCTLGEAALDDTAYVAVYDIQGVLVRTVPMLLEGIDTVTQIDDCLLVPENLCIETTTYIDTVSLTPQTGGYHIAYQRCCRNATILNIVDPLNTGATYDIVLTEAAMAACNTSPKIKAWPPTFICVNRPLLFDHSAEDKEGDSLVYKLCTPLDGGISLVNPRPRPAFPPPYDAITWKNPTYNLANLLGGKALTIDPKTGILTGTPAITGQFVVGVCVEEYRNGQVISETRRDFQYNVIPCQEITANFDTPSIPCDNFNIALNNTSLGATDYLWKFLDQDRVLGTSSAVNPSFTFPKEGSYTIRLIVDKGTTCVDSMDQTINLNLEAKATDFVIEIDGCQDSLVLQLKDLSEQTGVIATDWRWTVTGTIDQFISTESNPSFLIKNTQSFDISLAVQTINGCFLEAQKQTTVVVIEDAASISPPDTINTCGNDIVALNPNFDPNLVYDWSFNTNLPDPTIPNPIVEIDSPNKYTVRISDSTGICQFDKVVVIDTAAYIADLAVTTSSSCDGQSLTFKANQTAILVWDFGDGASLTTRNNAPIEHTYAQMAAYEVIVTDITPGRCMDQIILPINTSPVVIPAFSWRGDNCTSSSIELLFTDESTLPQDTELSWFWELSDGSTSTLQNPTFTITENAPTTVKLTVQSDNDRMCTATKTVIIPPLLLEESRLETISTCSESTIALNPNFNPALQYDWSANEQIEDPFSPNPNVFVTTPTSYLVQISDSLGICQFDRIIAIDTTNTPPINITTNANCDGKGITFQAEEAGTYVWDFGDGTPSIESDASSIEHIYDAFGTYSVRIQYTPSNGCTSTEVLPIDVVSGIEASFDWSGENCSNSSIELVLEDQTKSTQGPINTWLWELSDGRTSTEANPIFKIDTPEAIQVRLTTSSSNNPSCTSSTALTIPALLIDPSNLRDTITGCTGQLIALNPNPLLDYEYDWSDNEGLDFTDPNNPKALVNENTIYTGIVSNEFACSAIKNVYLVASPEIEIEATQDLYFCEQNLQTELFAYSDQAKTQWWLNEKGDTLGTDPELMIELSQTEQFSVTIEDEYGCTQSKNITISNAPIDLSYDAQLQICESDTLQLAVVNNDTNRPLIFSWSPEETIINGVTTNTPIVFPSENTIYEFLALDEHGCEFEGVIPITFHPVALEVDIESENNLVYVGEAITLVATENAAYNYSWTPSSSLDNPSIATPIASPTENTAYQVSVENEFGCTATASINVEVQAGICEEPYIFLPNAFTPDGDGENDILYLRGAIISKMELIIYDRWGDEIFKTNSPDIGWDGTKNGKAQPSGVFGYYIYVECINGEEFYKQGNVSLIR